jgi:hypothetical protein
LCAPTALISIARSQALTLHLARACTIVSARRLLAENYGGALRSYLMGLERSNTQKPIHNLSIDPIVCCVHWNRYP